jgi:hypothetical protein
VQKFSNKGWLCKTWEGELALVSLPGTSVEKFLFTVRDEAVAAQINKVVGQRVSLHYEEKVGLPTSCFGETRYYVTGVHAMADVPLGPGVVLPSRPGAGVGGIGALKRKPRARRRPHRDAEARRVAAAALSSRPSPAAPARARRRRRRRRS